MFNAAFTKLSIPILNQTIPIPRIDTNFSKFYPKILLS